MSSAEELAQEFETGEMVGDLGGGSKGKRSKAEQAEHKHPHPEGATRKTGEGGKIRRTWPRIFFTAILK